MTKELKGKNIILRPIKKSDIPLIFKFTKSPDIPRYTFVPSPNTVENIETFIKKSRTAARKGTDYVFAMVPLETGQLAGTIGIHSVSAYHKKAEIGYWLAKKYRGQGIMPEAVGLALRFCFRELKLQRVQASTLLDNKASQKLLKKCGFSFEGIHRNFYKHKGRIKDAHMYAITAQDFRAMRKKK